MGIPIRLIEKELKKFAPLHDWVVIKKKIPPGTTEAGIIVPNDGKELQSKQGTVVKIGTCNNLRAAKLPVPQLAAGDEVLFSAFSGMEIPMPIGYLIMRTHDILAVLE